MRASIMFFTGLLTGDSVMAPKLETLREKMETLTAREADVRKELEYTEMQPGNKRRQEVAHWLDSVAQKRAKVESIEKECQQSAGWFSSVFHCMDSHIQQIEKDVQDLIEMGKFPNNLVMKDPVSKEVPFNLEPSFGEKFRQNVEIIEKWFQDPLACCIGLHGMGGVGKTTLLKHIYNKLQLTGTRVHWITASNDCSLSMLQQKIAKAIGVKLSDGEVEDRRAAMLHNSLVRIGKAVLIIDDMWESLFTVESIGIPNGENGCKIILSTRKIEVCRSMGCKDYVIRVQSLSEDVSIGGALRQIIGKWWTIDLDDDLKRLENKVHHLSAKESDILTAVEHAEIQQGKKRKREVEWWFKSVKQKKTEFEDIVCKITAQGPSKVLKSCIEKKAKEIEELIQQGRFPSGVVLDDHASRRLPMVTTTLLGQRFTQNIGIISRMLKGDDVFVIGVHGMGGVGKTALLKQIHNCLLRDHSISGQVYWVTASRECRVDELQRAIGKTLGLDLTEEGDERRKAIIFQRFSQLGKSVLILDDIWKYYSTDQLGIPLQQSGCKIVLSTRSLDLCRRMGCQDIIKVVPLDKDEASSLFSENLGALPNYLNPIAEKIVEECGGLPLALITMGRSMRGVKDLHLWENALSELRKPVSWHDDMADEVYRVLKFSFDSLKDEKVQQCFLSCVLFQEDEVICQNFLVDLWIMEGLFDEIEYRQDQVNKGLSILDRLVNLNLLEVATKHLEQRCVTMHDLIRDMAIIITQNYPRYMAKSGLQLKRVPTEEQWSKDLVKVSLRYNKIKELPTGLLPETPLLRVLMFSHNPLREIPDSFFWHMKALRVLDLCWTHILRLPESISNLENLRALLLQNCENLTYVPSLAKLTKLKVLDLPDIGNVKEVPKGIEKLKSLEKLTNCPWNISDLSGFNNLIKYWPYPTQCCYEFWLHNISQTPCSLKAEHCREFENRVVISGVEFGQDDLSPVLPPTTALLGICDTDIQDESVLEDVVPSLLGVIELKVLIIKNCRGLRYISSSQQGIISYCTQFETLEHLELKKLPDWKGLIKVRDNATFLPVSSTKNPRLAITFSHLKQLSIVKCPKVKVVFPLKVLQQPVPLLQNLEEIKVIGCEELQEIFSFPITCTTENPIITFPKLKALFMKECPSIKVVFPLKFLQQQQQQQPHFSNLESIQVENCEKLEEIFTSLLSSKTPILNLPSLRCLFVKDLPEMESIYRGLLCIPCNTFTRYELCPKFGMVPLSKALICDISWSTLASIPSYTDCQDWWAHLYRDYPEDARLLLGWVNEIQQLQRMQRALLPHLSYPDDGEQDRTSRIKRKWGLLLQLSSC